MKTIIRPSNLLFALLILLFCGCSSSTGGKSEDITPPPVPSGLTITKIDNGSASLTWNAVSDNGLQGYNVYWTGETAADTLNANRMFVNTNSITIAGLDYETIYHFAVSSIDMSNNESALSVQESGKPLNTTSPQPPADVNIVAENIDYPKIMVYWSENQEPDIAYYKLYKSMTVAGLEDTLSFVTDLTQVNYTDIDVEIGTAYYYRVTAVDNEGWESAASTIVNDYVLDQVKLLSPVLREYTSTAPNFVWAGVNGAETYNVVLSSTRIGGEIWNIQVDKNTAQVIYSGKTKLISGNTYYWRVGAISKVEINSISDVGAFVVRTQ